MTARELVRHVAPGASELAHYDLSNLRFDAIAGLSVAAVAVPIGLAYASLAGFSPEVGLYACILPPLAYALFGSSRQLIVGPDAATCALVAASLAPLAGGDMELYQSLSVALALLVGLACLAGRVMRLGALADFLSTPILVGFLNGVALGIATGQIGKFFGVPIEGHGVVRPVLELVGKLGLVHLPTLGVALGTLAVMLLVPRWLPRVPTPLVAVVGAAAAVKLFDLGALGVKTLPAIPVGLPSLRLPVFPTDVLPQLVADAAGLALVSFSGMMIAARSFAAKNRYDIDADREFAALGAADIASALSQGFAVSGAASRTAVSDAAGGRTRMTGVVSALGVAAALVVLADALRYVPTAAIAGILVMAAFSLIDVAQLRALWRLDRMELAISIVATLAVIAVGSVNAILVSVGLALVRFVRLVSRPEVEVLGEVPGQAGVHSIASHADAKALPGLLMIRFNAPLVFFNAPYWKRAILDAVADSPVPVRWLALDMIPITLVDATGLYTARETFEALSARGIVIALAGRRTELARWRARRGAEDAQLLRTFATLDEAVAAFRAGG